jgi:hypothetical protein
MTGERRGPVNRSENGDRQEWVRTRPLNGFRMPSHRVHAVASTYFSHLAPVTKWDAGCGTRYDDPYGP